MATGNAPPEPAPPPWAHLYCPVCHTKWEYSGCKPGACGLTACPMCRRPNLGGVARPLDLHPVAIPGLVVYAAHYDGTSSDDPEEFDENEFYADRAKAQARVDMLNDEWRAVWEWRAGSSVWSVLEVTIK